MTNNRNNLIVSVILCNTVGLPVIKKGFEGPIYWLSPSSFLVCHKPVLDYQEQTSRFFMLKDL